MQFFLAGGAPSSGQQALRSMRGEYCKDPSTAASKRQRYFKSSLTFLSFPFFLVLDLFSRMFFSV
jgi:hypothetical protein